MYISVGAALLYSSLLLMMLLTFQPIVNYLFYILFIYCVTLGQRKKFILNPYYLFAVTLLSLMSYNSKLSYFLISIPFAVHLLIFFGVISFLGGMIVADSMKGAKKRYEKANIKTSNMILFVIVLLLGLIPHVIGIINVGAPILSGANAGETRDNYLPNGLSYFIFFLPVTILIAYADKNRTLIILSLSLNALMATIRLSKFDMLIFIFFSIFAYIKYGQSSSKALNKYLVLAGVFLSVPYVFDWFYTARMMEDSAVSRFSLESIIISEDFRALVSLPYLYFTTGWSNLTQTILSVQDFNHGLYTAYPFISALQMEELIGHTSEKFIYRHPFNTHAFLADYYMDFGVAGVIFIPFLVGFFVFQSYKQSIITVNPIKDAQFIILAIPTLLLFFSNHFSSVGYPFIVYILYGIVGLIPRMKFGDGKGL